MVGKLGAGWTERGRNKSCDTVLHFNPVSLKRSVHGEQLSDFLRLMFLIRLIYATTLRTCNW